MVRRTHVLIAAFTALATLAATTAAVAQEKSPGRHRAAQTHATIARSETGPYRSLTVNSAPVPGIDEDPDQDLYRDGPVRYNDVRDFSPAPYTTSGVQFPYGLDGIGGYGSDFDDGAGNDAALLDRGAGTRP